MGGVWLFVARRRRWVAAGFAAAATGFALPAVHPPRPPSATVLVAARDLPGGAVLTGRDLRPVPFPAALVPEGAISAHEARHVHVPAERLPTGRVLAGPMRRGEPLTDARLLHGGLLKGYGADLVAAPVRIADPGAVRLLHPGDRVDVLAADGAGGVPDEVADDLPDDLSPAATGGLPAGGGPARLIAASVPVIAVPRPRSGDDLGQGALVVLATDRRQASALAGAQGRLSITVVTGPAR